MFIYLIDTITYYHLDGFRYDKEKEAVSLIICNHSKEIVLDNINRAKYFRIRKQILHDLYFEISSKEYNWSILDMN